MRLHVHLRLCRTVMSEFTSWRTGSSALSGYGGRLDDEEELVVGGVGGGGGGGVGRVQLDVVVRARRSGGSFGGAPAGCRRMGCG